MSPNLYENGRKITADKGKDEGGDRPSDRVSKPEDTTDEMRVEANLGHTRFSDLTNAAANIGNAWDLIAEAGEHVTAASVPTHLTSHVDGGGLADVPGLFGQAGAGDHSIGRVDAQGGRGFDMAAWIHETTPYGGATRMPYHDKAALNDLELLDTEKYTGASKNLLTRNLGVFYDPEGTSAKRRYLQEADGFGAAVLSNSDVGASQKAWLEYGLQEPGVDDSQARMPIHMQANALDQSNVGPVGTHSVNATANEDLIANLYEIAPGGSVTSGFGQVAHLDLALSDRGLAPASSSSSRTAIQGADTGDQDIATSHSVHFESPYRHGLQTGMDNLIENGLPTNGLVALRIIPDPRESVQATSISSGNRYPSMPNAFDRAEPFEFDPVLAGDELAGEQTRCRDPREVYARVGSKISTFGETHSGHSSLAFGGDPRAIFSGSAEGRSEAETRVSDGLASAGEGGVAPTGWLTALMRAVITEFVGAGLHSGSGSPSGSSASQGSQAGPRGTRNDPLHVKLVDHALAYGTHMPAGPASNLPSQSLPVPGQVLFSP